MATLAQAEAAAPRGLDLVAMAKEAGVTALIALVLTAPLIGIRTVEQSGSLGFETDFTAVAIAVALVFVGRIGIILNREGIARPVLWLSLLFLVVFPLPVIYELLRSGFTLFGVQVPLDLPPLPVLDFHSVPLLVIGTLGSIWLALQALLVQRRHRSSLSRQERDRAMDKIGAKVQRATVFVGPILVLLAVVFPFTDLATRATLGVATIVLIYIMLGWGLNIIVGLAGLLDLGYVAFYAVGAYSYALLSTTFGLSFWICLPLAGVLAACFGLILGYPVLRLRGDYFAIVTLGFGEIIRIILINWAPVTGGPNGINNIPRPSFFGFPFDRSPPDGTTAFHQLFGLEYSPTHRIVFLYLLILALALLVNFISTRLRRLPVGRGWEAIREDDIACQSLGINRTNLKLAAFATSAMCGGFAGSFFATYQGFISPESFSFIESAIVLAIVVLGGMGSQLGIVVAACLIIGLPEAFRGLDLYRMLVFGLCMVGIMVWRPRGLLAHRDPTILLNRKKGASS
ncbi:MAG TPA: high-affinity branched-chain amino acid ABC transporter permease LivM [Inquilinus sp.]|nr:high-affinity branched-chain amino acid ABC transporter permease LivM [Inquilinus sp.]